MVAQNKKALEHSRSGMAPRQLAECGYVRTILIVVLPNQDDPLSLHLQIHHTELKNYRQNSQPTEHVNRFARSRIVLRTSSKERRN
jgi:hypothetical protein